MNVCDSRCITYFTLETFVSTLTKLAGARFAVTVVTVNVWTGKRIVETITSIDRASFNKCKLMIAYVTWQTSRKARTSYFIRNLKKGYVKKVDDEDKWKQTLHVHFKEVCLSLFRITKTIFLTSKILENSDVSYYCNNIIYFLQTRCGWRKDLNKDLKKIH